MVDRCPKCGQPFQPGANFCTSCGYRHPVAEAPPNVAATDYKDQLGAWPSFNVYSASARDPASSQGAAAPADPSAASTTAGDDGEAAVESLAGAEAESDAGADAATSADSELGGPPMATVDEPQPSRPDGAMGGDGLDVAPTVDTGAGSTQALGDDTLTRTRSLLEELAAMLPALAALAAAATAADRSGLVEILTQARDAAAAEENQFGELFAVVETAKSRPRDIDVMVDLSRQVEAIVTLKTGYDRSRAAIETALAQVQSG
jgi:hypothetical protein